MIKPAIIIKKSTTLLLPVLLLIPIIVGCEKETETPVVNLIPNGSFEINGQPSLDGWKIFVNPRHDTTGEIAEMAPLNGGQYSLGLKTYYSHFIPDPEGEGFLTETHNGKAETWVTGLKGTIPLQLTAFIKGSEGSSSIGMKHIRGGQVIDSKVFEESVIDKWTAYTLTDTFDLVSSDSIFIQLTERPAHVSAIGYYDLVELIRLDR